MQKEEKIFDQIVLVLASLRKSIFGKFPQTRQMAILGRTIDLYNQEINTNHQEINTVATMLISHHNSNNGDITPQ